MTGEVKLGVIESAPRDKDGKVLDKEKKLDGDLSIEEDQYKNV
jgi:hypothetical protein